MTTFNEMTGPQLVEAHNKMLLTWIDLAGDNTFSTVQRFSTREAGVRRCLALHKAIMEKRAGLESSAEDTRNPVEVAAVVGEEPPPMAPEELAAVPPEPTNEELVQTEESDDMAKQTKRATKRAKHPARATMGRRATGDRRETLREQMARYNDLVRPLVRRKIPGFRILGANGTTFATRAQGDAAIARAKKALAQCE